MFREEYKRDYIMVGILPMPKFQKIRNIEKAFAKSATWVGYFCNILRILLLVLGVFEKQYHWGLLEYPISEAVVTSLAFEKVIKTH